MSPAKPTITAETRDRLEDSLRRHQPGAAPCQLRPLARRVAASVAEGDRHGASHALIDLAAVALALADRPERIAVPGPPLLGTS